MGPPSGVEGWLSILNSIEGSQTNQPDRAR